MALFVGDENGGGACFSLPSNRGIAPHLGKLKHAHHGLFEQCLKGDDDLGILGPKLADFG